MPCSGRPWRVIASACPRATHSRRAHISDRTHPTFKPASTRSTRAKRWPCRRWRVTRRSGVLRGFGPRRSWRDRLQAMTRSWRTSRWSSAHPRSKPRVSMSGGTSCQSLHLRLEAMIFKSPHPDVEIPETTLRPLVLRHAERLGNKVAIVEVGSGRSYTYAELASNRSELGAGLHAKGFGKGDVMAILAPNLPEYPIAFLGVASVGGVNTTLNPLYTADEIAFQLRDSKARFLLTVPPLIEKAKEAALNADVKEIIVFGEAEGAIPFASLLAGGVAPETHIDPEEDLVALPYSSGTTGFSKGVMLTHRNLVANLAQAGSVIRIGDDEKIIAVLPFFHIYGMTVIMNGSLYQGATIVTMPRFELEPFLQAIQDFKITRLFLAPPIVVALAKPPIVDKYDLSSVKVVFSGAAPLDAETARLCGKRIGCRVSQGYGLNETSPVSHAVPGQAPEVG